VELELEILTHPVHVTCHLSRSPCNRWFLSSWLRLFLRICNNGSWTVLFALTFINVIHYISAGVGPEVPAELSLINWVLMT
jgi:hypothetical protein